VPHAVALAAARAEEAMARITGRAPKAPVTGVRLAGPRLGFDNARARGELGFEPPPVDVALRDAILWLRAAGRIARPLPALDREDSRPGGGG
jgi:dihydroflavonol-4-reductase